MIDLTDLRNTLFKHAKLPGCIACIRKQNVFGPYQFTYISPKADLNATWADRILIVPEDTHHIFAHIFSANAPTLSQRLMWTSPVEQRLLAYLDNLPKLRELPLRQAKALSGKKIADRPDWVIGSGFERATENTAGKELKNPSYLKKLPYISGAEQLNSWVLPFVITGAYPREIRRENFSYGFFAPHIIMPLSPDNKTGHRLRACYSEQDFSFPNTCAGITVPPDDAGKRMGKFLTAFLNSTFAAWFMGTSTNLGVDRERFAAVNILSLPFPKPEDLPDPDLAREIRDAVAEKMDTLMRQATQRQEKTLSSPERFPADIDIQELDRLIYSYFGLQEHEITVIQESMDLVRPAMHPGRNSSLPLWQPADTKHWQAYCAALGNALTDNMREGVQVFASVVGKTKDAMLVRVTRIRGCAAATVSLEEQNEINKLPDDLYQNFESHMGGNLFIRRFILNFRQGDIFILKPRQRRFWLIGAAYADADRILGHVLASKTDLSGNPA